MRKHLTSPTSIAPLAVFRALFGFIMAVSVVRFALNGWIYELYVRPTYHFAFFDGLVPLSEIGMYALFAVMGVAAVGVMLGLHYRVAIVLFFLTFTYVELLDKTNYLNHYYFVSIVSFLLIWVPANRAFSLDVRREPGLRADTVPAWTITIFKLQLVLVYFFAGAAKLNPDWLLEAMPLRLWLPAHAHLPLIGGWLAEPAAAYAFSWAGAAYDLTIAFFLLWGRTRILAYAAVVIFHLTTALLFQIGMFPYIMILCTLIFFPASVHEKVVGAAVRSRARERAPVAFAFSPRASTALAVLLCVHFAAQIVVPLRAALYPGNLFWTEQGYRFSWRVMLMEKAGSAVFEVHDPATGRRWEVSNWEYLTPNQEKMMATQPDMILQFAHHLAEEYRRQGMEDLEIRARAHVTLNGRKSSLLVDPNVDLTQVRQGLGHKDWVLPLPDDQESWISTNRP